MWKSDGVEILINVKWKNAIKTELQRSLTSFRHKNRREKIFLSIERENRNFIEIFSDKQTVYFRDNEHSNETNALIFDRCKMKRYLYGCASMPTVLFIYHSPLHTSIEYKKNNENRRDQNFHSELFVMKKSFGKKFFSFWKLMFLVWEKITIDSVSVIHTDRQTDV